MLIWDDIRYFLAVARASSLSGAARALDVEHTTVARRIGQLERAISGQLFHRLARGWKLTAEGAELLRRAESVEQEIASFGRAASGMDTLTGVVRISAPPLVLCYLITPNVGNLTSSHPELTLELIGERRSVNLLRAEADIAVRLTEPTEPDLIVRSLGTIRYGLYGVAREVERARQERGFIGFDDHMPDFLQKSWLEAYAQGCRINVKANDMATMLQAALAGLGIALLPEFLARSHASLHRLDMDAPLPSRALYLAMHPDIRRAQRVQLVGTEIGKILADALRD
ncbi:LysR family transcriptional regulator [Burkholderia gladioli pv. gladioli]